MKYISANYEGKEYKLDLTFNALEKFEEALNEPVTNIFEAFRGFKNIRIFLWAMLQRFHSEEFESPDSIKDLPISFFQILNSTAEKGMVQAYDLNNEKGEKSDKKGKPKV